MLMKSNRQKIGVGQIAAGDVVEESLWLLWTRFPSMKRDPFRLTMYGSGKAPMARRMGPDAELPPDRRIAPGWLEEWPHAGVNFSEDRGRLPRGYGGQGAGGESQ
jgi:hypothetical protein